MRKQTRNNFVKHRQQSNLNNPVQNTLQLVGDSSRHVKTLRNIVERVLGHSNSAICLLERAFLDRTVKCAGKVRNTILLGIILSIIQGADYRVQLLCTVPYRGKLCGEPNRWITPIILHDESSTGVHNDESYIRKWKTPFIVEVCTSFIR